MIDRALAAGLRSHVAAFFSRARGFIREAILAGAMALAGPGPLSEEDLAEVDRQAAAQGVFLEGFQRDVELRTPPELGEPSGLALTNPMTAAEFAARAESYSGSVWTGNINHNRRRIISSGRFNQERRRHRKPLSDHNACSICREESSKGWQPIGTLREIGDSECLGIRCDCYFEYRNAG